MRENHLIALWRSGLLDSKGLPDKMKMILTIGGYLQILTSYLKTTLVIASKNNTSNFSVNAFVEFFQQNQLIDIENMDHIQYILSTLIIIFILLWAILMLFSLDLVRKKKRIPTLVVDILAISSEISFLLISFPIFNILTFVAIKSFDLKNQSALYFSSLILSIILNALNIIQALTYLFMLVPLPSKKNSLARLTNDFFYGWIIEKLVAGFLISINSKPGKLYSDSDLFLMCGLNLLFSVFSTYLFIAQSMFTKRVTTDISIFFQAGILSIAISNFLIWLLDIQPHGTTLSIVLFILLIFLIMMKILANLHNYLSNWERVSKKHGIGVNLRKTYALLKYINVEKHKKILDPADRIFSKKKVERVQFLKFVGFFEDLPTFSEELKLILFRMIRNDQKNNMSFHLAIAYLLCHEFFDYHQAYILTEQILNSIYSSMNIKFGALSLREFMIKKKIDVGSVSAEREKQRLDQFFNIMENFDVFQVEIRSHLDEKTKFYNLIQEFKPNLLEIAKYSARVQRSHVEIENSWKKFPEEIIRYSPRIIKTYALYSMAIGTEPDRGHNLIKFATKIAIRKNNSQIQESTELNKLYHEDTLTILCNASQQDFGTILKISPSVQSLLGYNSAAIIGKNYESMLSPIMRDIHRSSIEELYKSGEKRSKLLKIPLFVLHTSGHSLKYDTLTRVFPTLNQGLLMWIILVPTESSQDFVVTDGKGYIDSGTKNFFEEFDLGSSKSVINITSFCEHQIDLNPKCPIKQFNIYSFKAKENDDNYYFQVKWNQEILGTRYFLLTEIKKRIQGRQSTQTRMLEGGLVKFLDAKSQNELSDLSIAQEVDPENHYHLKHLIPDEDLFAKEKRHTYIKHTTEHKANSYLGNEDESFTAENFDVQLGDDKQEDVLSYISNKGDQTQKRFKSTFDELTSKISFGRYRGKHMFFFWFLVFLTLFAISLLNSYLQTNNLLDKILIRLDLLVNIYGRSVFLFELTRSAWADRLFKDYYNTSTSTYQARWTSNYVAAGARLVNSSKYQQNVKITARMLDDGELKNFMFERNVKMFYENFDSAPNNQNFTMEDSMTAFDSFLTFSQRYYKNMPTNTSLERWINKYLTYNGVNELLIQATNIPSKIYDDVVLTLKSVNNKTETLYIASFIFFGIFFVIAILSLLVYLSETFQFLSILSNVESSYMQSVINDLEYYRKQLETGIKDKKKKKFLNPKQGNEENKLVYKIPDRKSLVLRVFIARLLMIFCLLIPPISMLSSTFDSPNEINSLVTNEFRDIMTLNKIAYKMTEIYTEIATYLFFKNFTIKMRNVSDLLIEDIDHIDDPISFSQGFGERLQNILLQDICPYYWSVPTRPFCNKLSAGIGSQGLIQIMYYTKRQIIQTKAFGDSLPYTTENVVKLSTQNEILDGFFLVMNGVNPAVNEFTAQLRLSLNDELINKKSAIITTFGWSIFIDVFDLLLFYILVYRIMSSERRKIFQTLKIIPLEFIVVNKHLKMYLIKEKKDFVGLVRDIDALRRSNKKLNK